MIVNNKIVILVLLLISLIIVAGCNSVGDIDVSKLSADDIDKVIKCESPYIRHAAGCCLDQNENKICDDDESSASNPNKDQTQDDEISPSNVCNPNEVVSKKCLDSENLQIKTCNPQGTAVIEIGTNCDNVFGFGKDTMECKNGECVQKEQISEPKPRLPEPTSNLDLSNYPQPFIDANGVFNTDTAVVVGENSPASDTLSAVDIMQQLQFDAKIPVAGGGFVPAEIDINSRLDSELLDSYKNFDLIIVGTADASSSLSAEALPIGCANKLMTKFGFDCDTGTFLAPGEGLLQFMKNGNNVALIVSGRNAIDTRVVAKVLSNYEDYALSGSRVMVSGTLNNPIVS